MSLGIKGIWGLAVWKLRQPKCQNVKNKDYHCVYMSIGKDLLIFYHEATVYLQCVVYLMHFG